MTLLDTSTVVLLLSVVLVAAVAVLAIVASVAGRFLVSNRRVRLARHESIPAYYGSLAFHH